MPSIYKKYALSLKIIEYSLIIFNVLVLIYMLNISSNLITLELHLENPSSACDNIIPFFKDYYILRVLSMEDKEQYVNHVLNSLNVVKEANHIRFSPTEIKNICELHERRFQIKEAVEKLYVTKEDAARIAKKANKWSYLDRLQLVASCIFLV